MKRHNEPVVDTDSDAGTDKNQKHATPKTISEVFELALKSGDFHQFSPVEGNFPVRIQISYYETLVNCTKINRYIVSEIQQKIGLIHELEDLKNIIPFVDVKVSHDPEDVGNKLIKGYVVLQLNEAEHEFLLVNVNQADLGHRMTNETENEFSVVGPKVGFVENIELNIHLLRQQISVPELVFEEVTVGSMSNTTVMIVYIDGVTNDQHVETARQRLRAADADIVFDSSVLDQIISDHTNTPFPLFLSTERVDRVVYAIINGQVAILSDGSPYVITGPSGFLDFFASPEDYYVPWIVGSFFRIIRIMSVIFSVFATPLYVAVLTYHFALLPETLLEPLIISRSHVPFPPFVEAIFLEITIELLREAGARLPAKIGQTLGIVGGIVIGQATVHAALTSNILLIIVALTALASFTTPIFRMANTIRLLRFPFILLAALWGGLGIVAGFLLLAGHLLRLKSLGVPYLAPIFPFRTGNFSDSFFRAPLPYMTKRRYYLKPKSLTRYRPKEDKEDISNE
ncbi:spore germination protein [Paenibacillus lignilyticus]|uniref:Spore germination protein n=1 Tax=Paenibacillus lignilyticus TaxID=1172615 RepID=A0ABS5C999_9BACL|nr:spore germination protein [Paenibacillus lignilyticus]MBP3962508.1 spore germination protein [Paenibacillus lignilyticus]